MSSYCPKCGNFMKIVELGGEPYQVCVLDDYRIRRPEPLVLVTYRGEGIHNFSQTEDDKSLSHRLENLSWERTMSQSSDVKCKKCKTEAVYMINPSSKLYVYACPSCHTTNL